jgi:hypothetical protein
MLLRTKSRTNVATGYGDAEAVAAAAAAAEGRNLMAVAVVVVEGLLFWWFEWFTTTPRGRCDVMEEDDDMLDCSREATCRGGGTAAGGPRFAAWS